jgi:hypothetical protein
MPPASLKAALEDLLRTRKLQADAPPLRGVRTQAPVGTGIAAVDPLIAGGFPRGQLSEVHGRTSSGRTGLLLAAVARATRRGSLAAWVDPADTLSPESAGSAGADLTRLLWLRGRALPEALQAAATLVGSGLFEIVVFDVAGVRDAAIRRLPGTSWIRLQRAVADTQTALVLLASSHVACGPGGASLALRKAKARWSGARGPGRLLRGIDAEAVAGRHSLRRCAFSLEL